jgi:hypothetical protein
MPLRDTCSVELGSYRGTARVVEKRKRDLAPRARPELQGRQGVMTDAGMSVAFVVEGDA